MNDDKKITLSEEGLENIKQELEERKTLTRKKIADDIDHARQQGDLSENSAYKAALENKEFNENRITELEDILKVAIIGENTKKSTVGIGSKVMLKNLTAKQEIEYEIVGEHEANPLEKKISVESPLAQALKGKRKGDKVKLELPAGTTEYEVLKVS